MPIEATPPPDPAANVRALQPLQRPRRASETMPPAGRRDRVEVSGKARELLEATQATAAADADRAELVLQLRQQIAEGSYAPDAEAVARALLERLQS